MKASLKIGLTLAAYFSASAVFAAATTGWLGTPLQYDELVDTNSTTYSLISNQAHPTPVVLIWSYSDASSSHSNVATFSSTPAPFLQAQTVAYNSLTYTSEWLAYQFGIHGAPDSVVPVLFQGSYALSGDNLSVYLVPGLAGGGEVQISAGSNTNTDAALDVRCSSSCIQDTYGSIAATQTNFSVTQDAGKFIGTTLVHLDANGFGIGEVSLGASASSFAAQGVILSDHTTAFIDPQFEIDPAYLLDNPDTQLFLPDGVGNGTVSSVPEPSTLLVLGCAMGMLALRARRSNRYLRK